MSIHRLIGTNYATRYISHQSQNGYDDCVIGITLQRHEKYEEVKKYAIVVNIVWILM